MANKYDPVPVEGGTRTGVEIAAPGITVSNTLRNVFDGPVTLKGVVVDNTDFTATPATKVYVKLYDVIDNSWVSGTSTPALIIPVAIATANAADQLASGYTILLIDPGVKFRKGLSILVAKEPGDTNTNAPANDVTVWLLN